MKYLVVLLLLIPVTGLTQSRAAMLVNGNSTLKLIANSFETSMLLKLDRLLELEQAQMDSLLAHRLRIQLLLQQIEAGKAGAAAEIKRLRAENAELQKLLIYYREMADKERKEAESEHKEPDR